MTPTGQPGQNGPDRTARTGQPGEATRAGLTGQDRTTRTQQPWKTGQDRETRIGQPNRTVRIELNRIEFLYFRYRISDCPTLVYSDIRIDSIVDIGSNPISD
jgi:hypothetical protein